MSESYLDCHPAELRNPLCYAGCDGRHQRARGKVDSGKSTTHSTTLRYRDADRSSRVGAHTGTGPVSTRNPSSLMQGINSIII